MGMCASNGPASSPAHIRHPSYITAQTSEDVIMMTFLFWYCLACYLVMVGIFAYSRHDIVMVHLRNPIKYSMEKIYLICFVLFVASPISIYWVLYEFWDDMRHY